ncbi:tetratricopeptide repeat protein [Nocardiopsis sp. MG754419]|uniref:tetratricopeptide repeat protein n=1 Tax=Nocardiopsis sp. MG754419 TaxID=2259865 RepID=UPI001BA68505|nr:tetratricopeptide repeat protein [Nocardiopsis sp. MG754419]MBR8740452.1 co-chaperone YbbN [Nocardiopsis sp. MG754419]
MQPSDFSPNSAVDLGARKAALEREAKQRAEESTGRTNPYAVNVDESNFQQVLERSMSAPVVLAVLAGWSEQSKQVETALDKLSRGSGGNWILGRIDSEGSPQLVQALRVQGAPTIIIAIQGQVMPLMQGPATEEQLRDGLTQVFGALAQQGMLPPGHPGTVDGDPSAMPEEGETAPEPDVDPGDPVDAEAQAALDRGDFDAAAAVFEKALTADPRNAEFKAKLAQVRLIGRLQNVDPEAVHQAAADRPDDVDVQITLADIDMYGGKFEDAFDRLVAAVKGSADEDRDKARGHLLSLFDLLPAGDPRVSAARRKLTAALF